ncbi:2942_t:CDS:2, partial [Entrophospora sp. SA101]
FIEEWDEIKNNTFSELLKIHGRDLDVLHIHDEITHHYLQKSSTLLEPPNVVILKAGPEPNSDKNVFATCDLFEEDLLSNDTEVKNGYDKRLDIVADEAIFRRLVRYKKGHPKVFPMLGQFHTNKEMLAVLISAFSGYGIFNIAAKLGSRFLDKLDDVADYRATCRTIELLWVATGIAINLSKKVVNSRKESLWLLIDDLYNIFNGTIPLNDSLFKDVKEFNDEGLNNIFTCYNKGIQRLYTMLNEEVLQNLTIKGTVNTTIESSNIPPSTDLEQPPPTKNTRYRPSKDEKKILENLASFNETPSMDKIDAVLKSLLLLNPGYWN